MVQQSGTLMRSLWPAVFIACAAWLVWYFPRFILLAGLGNDNLNSSYETAGIVDLAVLAGAVVALVLGVRAAAPTSGEGVIENGFDKLSLFLARVSMLLIVILVGVMFYEVIVRYVFEAPTLWANELSLWMAGFIFLLAGLYAMQQRSHIRIYLLYDVMPRWLQRLCDVVSTALISVFAIAMIWGGYKEAHDKFLRWETFGTAFDPPIPATMKPMVLIVISLVAIQAIVNLITDWNKQAETHAVVDEGEIEEMIEHARHQHEAGRHD
ncbi:TRAP transporter small permease subunit [Tranquillimonas alkanivorans]|uniref:TRAP transporter small permease protein n=1 Tax=Tranquillimonas alkanivorans TaxID=441119 RepID=A0A1I5QC82_9RHOB|nr:TRAP transporter small permease [Tranquillimonas alkanivorans]SFP43919.1 TRAP-type mannitol/chloroaromatic compound transport system, small permease component [Tranquillimonas alkanivorans]